MPLSILQIEDLAISALKATPITDYVDPARIKPYNGELQSEEAVNRILTTFPLIFVMVSRGRLLTISEGQTFWRKVVLNVVVADKSLRGGAEARRDSFSGTYRMIDDVLKVLHLNNLGQPAGTVFVEADGWDPLITHPALSAFQVDFKIRFLNQ